MLKGKRSKVPRCSDGNPFWVGLGTTWLTRLASMSSRLILRGVQSNTFCRDKPFLSFALRTGNNPCLVHSRSIALSFSLRAQAPLEVSSQGACFLSLSPLLQAPAQGSAELCLLNRCHSGAMNRKESPISAQRLLQALTNICLLCAERLQSWR